MTPHQRIMRCARNGTGCRLTREEVKRLAFDNAISHRAMIDDEADETGWSEEELQPSPMLTRMLEDARHAKPEEKQ